MLMLRTWAVWNRDQCLSIIFPILYILFWGSGFAILAIFVKSITCKYLIKFPSFLIFSTLWLIYFAVLVGDPPYPGFKGCFPMSVNKYLVWVWVLLAVWDTRK